MTETTPPPLETAEQPSAEQQLADMKDLLQRTQANFENYRKQAEKRIEELKFLAAKGFILKLLPILDNFELALKNAAQHPQEFLKGMELVYAQTRSLLEEAGVKPIEKKEFDPYYHEALMKVPSPEPENTILEEFQKGFTLHEQVIRHARVKISAGLPSEKKNENKKPEEKK